VYRAHHSMLRRPTAVKLLDEAKANEVTLRRFEREVQLTSQLNHPNTVAIYDFGRTPEGVFYYAMEFLDGLTLQDLVARFGPQPEGRVIGILRQICGSLAEAHEVGLVHRDIKPANVLINRRGGLFDFVKVVDFGLVKRTSADDVALTQANAITGTPLYMAPETIEKSDDVDHRADLYAVGAVGYFLLTGTTVFQSDNLFDLLRKQSHDVPELPSLRCQCTVHPRLEQVLMDCLAKKPGDRPQSARELGERLAACDDATPWTDADARNWWKQYDSLQHPVTLAQTRNDAPSATLIGSAKGDTARGHE
ncbi:MAG: serine/threonine protein kinase, partial [Planctomycetaceae bacterium]